MNVIANLLCSKANMNYVERAFLRQLRNLGERKKVSSALPSRGYVYVWSNIRKRMNDRRIVQSKARNRVDHMAEVCTLTWEKKAS